MEFNIESVPRDESEKEQMYDLYFKDEKLLNRCSMSQVLEKIKIVVEAMVKPMDKPKEEEKEEIKKEKKK